MSDWIQTFTGKQFYPLEPDIELICIEDIAHALSMLCRFTGHCKHFYSVGQHSILMAQHMPGEYLLEGLLHDAAEAYINDMSRPVKGDIAKYRAIEFRLRMRIEKRFNLKDVSSIVKKVDNALLYLEGHYLMPNVSTWNIKKPDLFLPEESFESWSPQVVEAHFLELATIEFEKRSSL